MPVNKNTAIVALKGVANQLFTYCIEDVFLTGSGWEYFIEAEGVFIQLDLIVGVDGSFVLATGFDPYEYLDRVFALLLLVHLTLINFKLRY